MIWEQWWKKEQSYFQSVTGSWAHLRNQLHMLFNDLKLAKIRPHFLSHPDWLERLLSHLPENQEIKYMAFMKLFQNKTYIWIISSNGNKVAVSSMVSVLSDSVSWLALGGAIQILMIKYHFISMWGLKRHYIFNKDHGWLGNKYTACRWTFFFLPWGYY